MGVEIPVRSEWQRHLVATRAPSGAVYLLLCLRRHTCDDCRGGIRFETLWAGLDGEALRIGWCRRCFGATCARIELDEELRPLWRDRAARFAAEPIPCWNGARPAVEDLERRGLL